MHKQAIVAASVAAFTFFSPAFADQPKTGLAPTLSVGYSFGSAEHSAPSRLSARFDLRSDRLIASDSDGPQFGVRLLNVFELSSTRNGLESMHVLWHDMLAPAQLNEDGASSEGSSHAWLWWVGGGLLVGGAVALAISKNDDDDETVNNGCSPLDSGPGGLPINPTCGIDPGISP